MNKEIINNTKMSLKEQVDAQMATLNTKVPSYFELNDEGRRIVDRYISIIENDPEGIDNLGKEEADRIYKELDILIGTLKTHDVSIGDMFTELMMSINENSQPETKNSPLSTIKNLASRPKKVVEKERYRRAKILTNLQVIREKLEAIRSELEINASKLEIMAQNSVQQYSNTQYQIIALQEVLKKLQKEGQGVQLQEKTFIQLDESLQLNKTERRIRRKIDNCMGISINAATKAIMSRLLAQHNEELASDYDQDLSSLLPELKGIVVAAEANDYLIQSVDTHNQFVNSVNTMLREESRRSKEAIRKVQDISKGSAIDVETARVLTSDVLEVVTSLKQVQEAGKPVNKAFVEILGDFKSKLSKELESSNSYQDVITREDR